MRNAPAKREKLQLPCQICKFVMSLSCCRRGGSCLRSLRQKIDNLCFLGKLTLEELQEKHFLEFENMCLKLDNGKRDYEALAAKYDRISVDQRESLHDERQRKGGSPSRELMSYIRSKYPNHPVVELIKNLKDIGRKDIALILKPLVKNQA